MERALRRLFSFSLFMVIAEGTEQALWSAHPDLELEISGPALGGFAEDTRCQRNSSENLGRSFARHTP